jgi:hypothetical protein
MLDREQPVGGVGVMTSKQLHTKQNGGEKERRGRNKVEELSDHF